MKKLNVYQKRLFSIALFLQRWELMEQMYHTRQEYYCSDEKNFFPHFQWCLKQFPKIFPGMWQLDDLGRPYWQHTGDLNAFEAARRFLKLSGDEILCLLAPHYSYPPYQIKGLEKNARPGDLSVQMMSFIKKKQEEIENNKQNSK